MSESLDGAAGPYSDVQAFLRRFVVLREAQEVVLSLWVLHTWAIEAAWATPYIHITSPARRSGKSRLREVLRLLVARPLVAGGVTEATLFRAITARQPTLFIDEADAMFRFQRDRERNGAIAALLNNGYSRNTPVLRCVNRSGQQTVEEFDVFCAKALVGIGAIPDTVADRCLVIQMERRKREEPIERFRERQAEAEAEGLRGRLESWAEENLEALRQFEPDLPEALDDRAQDVSEPLLAIADLIGVGEHARAALVSIRADGADAADEDYGLLFLDSVRQVLNRTGAVRIATADLIAALCEDEEAPWSTWSAGRPITARHVAGFLRPFGVSSTTVRIGSGSPKKGYKAEDFAPVFLRWLDRPGPASVTPGTRVTGSGTAEQQPGSSLAAETAPVQPKLGPVAVTGVAEVTQLTEEEAAA